MLSSLPGLSGHSGGFDSKWPTRRRRSFWNRFDEDPSGRGSIAKTDIASPSQRHSSPPSTQAWLRGPNPYKFVPTSSVIAGR
eukprot:scaffold602_cov298-Pinguiococcus_pyrenoidosus.AAC.37